MSPEYVFTLLYILLSICIIYPPIEFISAGLTIPAVFGSLLGAEEERFVSYHIKRSVLTLLIFSLLPLGYVLGLVVFAYDDNITLFVLVEHSLFWKIFLTVSLILPLLALYHINNWYRDNWANHPIVLNLTKFCNNNSNWQSVASDIDREYRRIEKICIQTNAITRIIATENWIVKVSPVMLFVVHQSDANLIVKQADTHRISHINSNEVQYVTIEVKSSRPNVEPFTIRINGLDFKDLQDRIARTITVLPTVKFHQTLLDQFVDAFKDAVKTNPVYSTDQQLDQCIGCLHSSPNVKIQKLCDSSNASEDCQTCYCRPMWCIECVAKWFATRQDNEQPNTWLSAKCTCPMCRAKFCVLDVCMLDSGAS